MYSSQKTVKEFTATITPTIVFNQGISNHSTPKKDQNQSLNSSNNSFISVNSNNSTLVENLIDTEAENNMSAVEELTEQMKGVLAAISKLQSPAGKPVLVPLSKEIKEVDFKGFKDTMSFFPAKFDGTTKVSTSDHLVQFDTWCRVTGKTTDKEKIPHCIWRRC